MYCNGSIFNETDFMYSIQLGLQLYLIYYYYYGVRLASLSQRVVTVQISFHIGPLIAKGTYTRRHFCKKSTRNMDNCY